MDKKEKGCCGNHGHEEGGCCSNGSHEHKHEHKEGGCCGGHGHDHGHKEGGCCGHDHDHDHENTITLSLDSGEEMVCEVLTIFSIDDDKVEYIALLPKEKEDVLLYRFHEEGDEIELENIEDDAEFEKVSKYFMEQFIEDEAEIEE